jgi:D-apionolactonase
MAEPAWSERLAQAAREAAALGAQLEVAVQLGEQSAHELAALAEALRGQELAIARWLVFHKHERVTSAATLRLARETLNTAPSGAPICGGTDVYFTDLNRARPELDALDEVAYSLNPQVHAFDLLSLTETLAAQATTVTSARAFCGPTPIVVSPVTLRPRFNPNATGPAPVPAPHALPPEVDGRQLSLYGAGWTLGSIKYLAEAGAASLTYYETTGWRGVLEQAAGSPLPAQFPSQPGQLFPLYHVFAAVAPFRRGQVRYSTTSDPLAVEVLALEAAERTRLLLANLSDVPQALTMAGLPPGPARLQLLDHAAYARAAHDPSLLTEGGATEQIKDGALALTLPPFAVACIDC